MAKDHGDVYLVAAGNIGPIAPRCACDTKNGRWVVLKPDGSFWQFDPPTQLQKDIWLGTDDTRLGRGSERAQKRKEERMAMLRWSCFGCGKPQMP